MAASPTMSASSSTGSTPRSSSSDDAVQPSRGRARHPGAGRLRRARHRGQDRGGALRARAHGAVFRHLLRHADGGDRGGAQPRRPATAPARPSSARAEHPVIGLMTEWMRGNQLEQREAGGDLGGTMRLGAYAAMLRPGSRGRRDLRQRPRSASAIATATRSTSTTRSRLEDAGLALLRHVARRRAARDRRDPRPSLVHRRAVPPRAEVEARSSRTRCSPRSSRRRSTSRGWCDANARRIGLRSLRLAAVTVDRGEPRSAMSAMHTSRHIGNLTLGNDRPLALIAGPCALESRAHALEMAHALVELTGEARHRPHLQDLVRQGEPHLARDARAASASSEGLPILAEVRETYGCPVLTDVHPPEQCAPVAEAVDVLQIPAFLCRQTDLLVAAAQDRPRDQHQEGPVPRALGHEERRAQGRGHRQRATSCCASAASASATTRWSPTCARCRSWRETGYPVVFDATHSVQQPGGQGTRRGGDRAHSSPSLARAAVAVGVAAVFMETHQDPDHAPSDGPNMVQLKDMPALLRDADRVRPAGQGAAPNGKPEFARTAPPIELPPSSIERRRSRSQDEARACPRPEAAG